MESWRRHSYPVETLHTPSSKSAGSEQVKDDRGRIALPRHLRAVKDANNYAHNGRNLIICLDGTGDKFDNDNSNIVHIVGCLKKDDASQVTYYQPGIGTYNKSGLSNGFAAAADMAVGSGLGEHVTDAYRFLMQTYREGDKICIFGFSRGAYTARCLAGMLHKVGLLPAHNRSQLPFAYQIYKDDSDEGWEQSRGFKKTFCIDCNVYFVGVFDCVASVGFIPRKLPFSSTPTSKTGHFRHAMSLDERRAKFKYLPWMRMGGVTRQQDKLEKSAPVSNLIRRVSTGLSGKQNGSAEVSTANHTHQKSKTSESDAEKALRQATGHSSKETDVLEVWFMGCHADVGGGAVANDVRHKLSQIPLRWMIRQCFECDTGIIFSTAALAEKGLDVHTLWPFYIPQLKPVVGPSPTMMGKYERGEISPIQHRSSHYETFDEEHKEKKIDEVDQRLHFAEEEDDGTNREPIGEWTDELVEDYFDAMAKINDQLVEAKGWWILETWPIKVRVQHPHDDAWVKKVSVNMGRHRAIQDLDPKMHWTVRQRMAEKKYEMRARGLRNVVWTVVV